MHALEDYEARAKNDAAATRHSVMKSSLSRPVAIPAGFIGPISTIAKARQSLAADRARAGDILPFTKRVAPVPRPAPPPAQPMRPAAINKFRKLAAAPDRKHVPVTLDAAQCRELGDLFRKVVGQAVRR